MWQPGETGILLVENTMKKQAKQRLYAMSKDGNWAGLVIHQDWGKGFLGVELFSAIMLIGGGCLELSGELKRLSIDDVRVFNDADVFIETVIRTSSMTAARNSQP